MSAIPKSLTETSESPAATWVSPARGAPEPHLLSRLPKGVAFDCPAAGKIELRVPAGVHVDVPCRGVHWLDSKTESFEHSTLITVGAHGSVTYIDEFQGEGQAAQKASGRVEIRLSEGARALYCQIQHWGPATDFSLQQEFTLARQAELEVVSLCIGGSKGSISSESRCEGPGARIRVAGASRGDGTQKFDFTLVSRHEVPDTSSALDYLTVMADRSKAVFNGLICITPEGRRTDAYQKNRNMVLSPQAAVETYPKLEIATDEVKCAHGASVAPVSFDQLYYLQSRGIQAKDAELMIINGFTDPVVQKLPETCKLRERVTEALSKKHGLHPCGVTPLAQEAPAR